MENNLYAGVVVIGIKAPFDLLYYEIKDGTRDKVKIGTRVFVPYGEDNEKRAAIVFKLTNEKPSFSLKTLSEVVENNTPIDKKLIDFLCFVSDAFLIPLHTLANEHIEMLENRIFVKLIERIDEKNLARIALTSNGKKQIISNYLLNSSPVRLETIRRKFGASSIKYVEELEQSGTIKLSEKNIQKPNRLFRLLLVDSPTLQEITLRLEKSVRNSALKVTRNFLETKLDIVDEATLSHNVRNSRKALEKLVEAGILAETSPPQEKECNTCKPKRWFLIGGSLKERTDRIISLIKDRKSPCSILIIFPEIALIEKVRSKYEETFKENCITWDGKDYNSFINRVSSAKKIILATEGILFHNIQNLGLIVLEESTSRYYKPNSFSPFDTRLIAMKKAELNNLDIFLSASTADESLYYLMKENYFNKVDSFESRAKVKIIDMRAEFRSKNRNMTSYYLKRRINEALQSSKNIALVLNRKPYSTFVMCRECGYVMKCKNCGNTLYFDSERRLLYCPVCGYEEKPPDLCPRCKSPNIYYFGGGIQKLIPEIKSTFKNANILKMVSSDYMKRAIVNSREFTSTIFVGTEFLLSHLNADNISLFGFISIDTFIENYGHESGVNAFTIVQNAASEIEGKEIIIQTYTPENYVVNAIKNLDYKSFLDKELYLRQSLNYPPFFSLVILSFQNTQDEKVKSMKEYLDKSLVNKAQVLGPSNGKEPNTFEITIKVLGATPAQMKEALRSASTKSKVDFNLRVYPAFTYFNSENRA